MERLLLVSAAEDVAPLVEGLSAAGFAVEAAAPDTVHQPLEPALAAVLVDLATEPAPGPSLRRLLLPEARPPLAPVLALVPPDQLPAFDVTVGFDDFVRRDAPPEEVALRLRQAMWRRGGGASADLLRAGSLVIDRGNYRVSVEGAPVELTFREYELLSFLATNPDRVFTREMLLNRVWGYDFYGGARTVDVHVRRLRSKIEVSGRSYIETVRNVGYRFRAG